MNRPRVPYSDSDEDWEEEEDQNESEDTRIKHQKKKPKIKPGGSKIKSEEMKLKMRSLKPANLNRPVDQKEKKQENKPEKKKRTWDDMVDLYHMELRSERQSRYCLKSRVYEVHFDKFEEPFEWVHDTFQATRNQIKQDCSAKPKDKMRVSFFHPALDHGIFIPFDDCINMTGGTVLNEFGRVAQSNDCFNLHDGHMQDEITLTSMPSG